MMRRLTFNFYALLLTVFSITLLQACSGGDSDGEAGQSNGSAQEASGLTEFELKHGIGPVDEVVELGELDEEMAARGEEIFEAKCSAWQKPKGGYKGPGAGEILDRRSATYAMNMIMNPDEMTKKHPEGKKMMQEYMSPMPYQNVTIDEARAIVEYFRTIEME